MKKADLRSSKDDLSLTGFTFIKLILVISILSILTAISTPLFRHTFDNLQVRNFCRDISKLNKYGTGTAPDRF